MKIVLLFKRGRWLNRVDEQRVVEQCGRTPTTCISVTLGVTCVLRQLVTPECHETLAVRPREDSVDLAKWVNMTVSRHYLGYDFGYRRDVAMSTARPQPPFHVRFRMSAGVTGWRRFVAEYPHADDALLDAESLHNIATLARAEFNLRLTVADAAGRDIQWLAYPHLTDQQRALLDCLGREDKEES